MSRLFSLTFIVLSILELAMIGQVSKADDGPSEDYKYTYYSRDARIPSPTGGASGFSYQGMWNVREEPDKLLHIVLFPYGVSVSVGSTIGLNNPPGTSDITSHPDGLYLNGKPVCRGKGRRVFVYTKSRKLKPIPLKKEELKALLPKTIKKLSKTDIWKKKIKPVLDKEAWMKRPGDRPDEENDR